MTRVVDEVTEDELCLQTHISYNHMVNIANAEKDWIIYNETNITFTQQDLPSYSN